MFKLNRKIEYALISLRHMACQPQGILTSAKEISGLYHLPFDATSRSLQRMTQKGLLKSEQGVLGGYRLVKDLQTVSLCDLMEIILGPVTLARCLQSRGDCDLAESCNIRTPMASLNLKLLEFCRSISVYEMIHPEILGQAESVRISKAVSRASLGTRRPV